MIPSCSYKRFWWPQTISFRENLEFTSLVLAQIKRPFDIAHLFENHPYLCWYHENGTIPVEEERAKLILDLFLYAFNQKLKTCDSIGFSPNRTQQVEQFVEKVFQKFRFGTLRPPIRDATIEAFLKINVTRTFRDHIYPTLILGSPHVYLQHAEKNDIEKIFQNARSMHLGLLNHPISLTIPSCKFDIIHFIHLAQGDLDKKHILTATLLRLGSQQNPNFKETCIQQFASTHPELLLTHGTSLKDWSVQERLTFAQNLLPHSPHLISEYLFSLFSEVEVLAHPHEIESLLQNDTTSASKYNALYLKHLQTTPKPIYLNDGIFWTCIAERIEPGGPIRTFRLSNRYNFNCPHNDQIVRYQEREAEIDDLEQKIFPAPEPYPVLIARSRYYADMLKELSSNPFLHKLGYHMYEGPGGAYCEMPDHETIHYRWEQLRQTKDFQKLPPLPIATGLGNISPDEFSKVHRTHAFLLAYGPRHIHDQFYHAIPSVLAIASDPERYILVKANEVQHDDDIRHLIQQARERKYPETLCQIVEFSLSVFHDLVTTEINLHDRAGFVAQWIPSRSGSIPLFNRLWSADSRWRTVSEITEIASGYTVKQISDFWSEVG